MKNRLINKFVSLIMAFTFVFQQTGFAQAAMVELNLGGYLARMSNSFVRDVFRPPHIRFISYDGLRDDIKVMLDKGDIKQLQGSELKASAKELLNYFLIGVTLPNDTFWVNLRPDSEDNIIDRELAATDVGKIMLETDLQLKKDTASFTSPATPEGKEYWNRLYKKAGELYGYDSVTIPTLCRPWIVPGEIIVREDAGSAYIYKAALKVMLEQDYLKDQAAYSFKDPRAKAMNDYSAQLMRELIIPKLTKEVNLSKNYATLRQVYYSLILSRWFKARFPAEGGAPNHPIGLGVYSLHKGTVPELIDSKNLTNLTSKTAWTKSTYFNAYKKSFAEGEYNLKETVSTPTGQVIRTYFSGGENLAPMVVNGMEAPVNTNALVGAGLVNPNDGIIDIPSVMSVDDSEASLLLNLGRTDIDVLAQIERALEAAKDSRKDKIMANLREAATPKDKLAVLRQYFKSDKTIGAFLMGGVPESDPWVQSRRRIEETASQQGKDPRDGWSGERYRAMVSSEPGPNSATAQENRLLSGLKDSNVEFVVRQLIAAGEIEGKSKVILNFRSASNPKARLTVLVQHFKRKYPNSLYAAKHAWDDTELLLTGGGVSVGQPGASSSPTKTEVTNEIASLRNKIRRLQELQEKTKASLSRIRRKISNIEELSGEEDPYSPGNVMLPKLERLLAGLRTGGNERELRGTRIKTLQRRLRSLYRLRSQMSRSEERTTNSAVEAAQAATKAPGASLAVTKVSDATVADWIQKVKSGKGDSRELVGYVRQLGGSRNPQAMEYLLYLVVRRAEILERNDTSPFEYQNAAPEALYRLEKSLSRETKISTYLSIIQRSRVIGYHKRILEHAVDKLGGLKAKEAVQPLLNLLERTLPHLQHDLIVFRICSASLFALGDIGDEAAVQPLGDLLIRILSGKKSPVQYIGDIERIAKGIIENIGKIGGKQAITVLTHLKRGYIEDLLKWVNSGKNVEQEVYWPIDEWAKSLRWAALRAAQAKPEGASSAALFVHSDTDRDPLAAWEIEKYTDLLTDEDGIDADRMKAAEMLARFAPPRLADIMDVFKEVRDSISPQSMLFDMLTEASEFYEKRGERERPATATSSPVRPGGIDFRDKPMQIIYQPMGNFVGLNVSTPILSKAELDKFDVQGELTQVERMVENNILPSGERIKELLAASHQKGELEGTRERVAVLLVKMGILEEKQCSTQECSQEYKEALVLVDSLT